MLTKLSDGGVIVEQKPKLMFEPSVRRQAALNGMVKITILVNPNPDIIDHDTECYVVVSKRLVKKKTISNSTCQE